MKKKKLGKVLIHIGMRPFLNTLFNHKQLVNILPFFSMYCSPSLIAVMDCKTINKIQKGVFHH